MSEHKHDDGLNLPWKIYFFNEDGKYDKDDVLTITTTSKFVLLSSEIERCNDLKREIRVCDSLDYLIMHWKDGERIFPL